MSLMASRNRKDIAKAIVKAYQSLASHLDGCVEQRETKKCCQIAVGSSNFDRQCVRDYAFIIKVLSDCL